MKKITPILVMAILAVWLSAARGQDTLSDLKKLDAKLTNAFITHDFKMLDNYTADDFIMIDPRGGMHNKKGYFKYLGAGKSTVSDMKETDVSVRDFGDTAVVAGLLHVKGKLEDKDISPEYRWTRVYNKKKGDEWRCVLEQHTYVVPKDEGK
jgi:ketosteroid isomerase-like protein